MDTSDSKSITPILNGLPIPNGEQDAAEFFELLLDQIEREGSLASKLFNISYVVNSTCTSCTAQKSEMNSSYILRAQCPDSGSITSLEGLSWVSSGPSTPCTYCSNRQFESEMHLQNESTYMLAQISDRESSVICDLDFSKEFSFSTDTGGKYRIHSALVHLPHHWICCLQDPTSPGQWITFNDSSVNTDTQFKRGQVSALVLERINGDHTEGHDSPLPKLHGRVDGSSESPTTLPNVIIQIPYYDEKLDVIQNTLNSVQLAVSEYRKNGGNAKIVLNEDGIMSGKLTPEQINLRLQLYGDFGISWIARPKSPRIGQFKKAGNLNYWLTWALLRPHYNSAAETTVALLNILGYENLSTNQQEDGTLNIYDSKNQLLACQSGDLSISLDTILLLCDADTRVPASCIIDTVPEFIQEPKLAFTQHRTSPFPEQCKTRWQRFISHFTRATYDIGIGVNCAFGGAVPLVGHNAFLRWAAIKEVLCRECCDGTQGQNYHHIWCERRVSEDFCMFLELSIQGWIGRYIVYTGSGFEEGVSFDYGSEVTRLRKYSHGACEIMFHPLKKWPTKGPFSRLFRRFLRSPLIPWHHKLSIAGYLINYLAISVAVPASVVELILIIWNREFFESRFLHGFDITLCILPIFGILVPFSSSFLRHRIIAHKNQIHNSLRTILWMELKQVPIALLFFGSLPLHLTLTVFFFFVGIKKKFGPTKKDNDDDVSLWEVIRNNWQVQIGIVGLIAMIFVTLFFGLSWRDAWPLTYMSVFGIITPLILGFRFSRLCGKSNADENKRTERSTNTNQKSPQVWNLYLQEEGRVASHQAHPHPKNKGGNVMPSSTPNHQANCTRKTRPYAEQIGILVVFVWLIIVFNDFIHQWNVLKLDHFHPRNYPSFVLGPFASLFGLFTLQMLIFSVFSPFVSPSIYDENGTYFSAQKPRNKNQNETGEEPIRSEFKWESASCELPECKTLGKKQEGQKSTIDPKLIQKSPNVPSSSTSASKVEDSRNVEDMAESAPQTDSKEDLPAEKAPPHTDFAPISEEISLSKPLTFQEELVRKQQLKQKKQLLQAKQKICSILPRIHPNLLSESSLAILSPILKDWDSASDGFQEEDIVNGVNDDRIKECISLIPKLRARVNLRSQAANHKTQMRQCRKRWRESHQRYFVLFELPPEIIESQLPLDIIATVISFLGNKPPQLNLETHSSIFRQMATEFDSFCKYLRQNQEGISAARLSFHSLLEEIIRECTQLFGNVEELTNCLLHLEVPQNMESLYNWMQSVEDFVAVLNSTDKQNVKEDPTCPRVCDGLPAYQRWKHNYGHLCQQLNDQTEKELQSSVVGKYFG